MPTAAVRGLPRVLPSATIRISSGADGSSGAITSSDPATTPTGNPDPSALPNTAMSGVDAVVRLRPAEAEPETRDHLVEDEWHMQLVGQGTKAVEEARASRDAAHDRLAEDRRDLRPMGAGDLARAIDVVVGSGQDVRLF